MSFGLLNYSSPWFPFLCLLFPIIYFHLPQIFSHFIIPSLSWPSFGSCCVWFPFINSFNSSFIRHSFNISHPSQSLTFNVPYYISPFGFCAGPKILLNNLLSNTNNFCVVFPVNTQHLDPYNTTGLITVWYSLSLVFLLICLLRNIILFAKKVLLAAAILSFI